MTRNDKIVGTIRTAVPAAIAYGLALLVGKIPAVGEQIAALDSVLSLTPLGGTVQGLLEILLTGLIVAVYYRLAREAGEKWPWLEKWLMGSSQTPDYTGKSVTITAPSTAEHVSVEVEMPKSQSPPGPVDESGTIA